MISLVLSQHNTGKEIIIRLCPLDPVTKKPITTGLPYEVVPAAYPHDVWALGCVMYELCAGIKLFLQDDEDNIDSDAIYELYNFTDELKRRKLSKISDLQARNLVSQLLSRDPRRRPNFHQVRSRSFETTSCKLMPFVVDLGASISVRQANSTHDRRFCGVRCVLVLSSEQRHGARGLPVRRADSPRLEGVVGQEVSGSRGALGDRLHRRASEEQDLRAHPLQRVRILATVII